MYDIHTHFLPPEAVDWLKANQAKVNAKWIAKDPAKADFLSINGNWEFELKQAFVNPLLYVKEQEQAGVVHSLVSPIPQLFLYEFEAEITSELADVYNHALAGWTGSQAERLSALATVPLNDPTRAADSLSKAMGLGLKGAIIGSSWSGNLLSDDRFNPFWEAADAHKAIIFIHPLLSKEPRLAQKMMPNLIGVPWETTIAATDLMLNGHLDKYPNVKMLLAHGGGFLPYQAGRLEKGYEKWKAVSGNLQASPLEYVKQFWYDTVLWNPEAISYLMQKAGSDRVVPGSDFPFDLCEWPPYFSGDEGFASLMRE